jgi:hypothetical protein
VSVRLNTGGVFSAAPTVAASGYTEGVALADIDNDGDLDLLISSGSTVITRFNTASSTPLSAFQAHTLFPSNLYPNPALLTATLQLPSVAGATEANLLLVNTLGQAMQRRIIPLCYWLPIPTRPLWPAHWRLHAASSSRTFHYQHSPGSEPVLLVHFKQKPQNGRFWGFFTERFFTHYCFRYLAQKGLLVQPATASLRSPLNTPAKRHP